MNAKSYSQALGLDAVERCWICAGPLPADLDGRNRQGRICDGDRCAQARARIFQLVRWARRASKCSLCDAPAMENRRVCERHAYRRDPCEQCAGKVERVDRGAQRRACMGCHPPRTARKSP